jgi:O-antigen/teichoic acid export membrane protein
VHSSLIEKIKNLTSKLGPEGDLRSRVLVGSVWLGIGSGFEQGLRFFRNIILVRILAPEVFGVMAIVLAVKMGIETVTEVGIKKAIIQHPKGDDPSYLNAAWYLSLGRALWLFMLAYVCAPWVANFYDNVSLSSLIRITFIGVLFDGTLSSRAYVAIKQMKFKQWALINNGGGAIGVLTALLLACFMRDIWALVIGIIMESVARFIISYWVFPFLPRLIFDKAYTKDLLAFTRGVFGLGLLYFIYMRADVFVLGKLCTSTELGLYTMAISLAQIPFQFITALMDQMAMPVFSEMQNQNERINRTILRITKGIAYLCFPLLFFLFLHGRDLLALVYGPMYTEAALAFAIIFAAWLFRFCSIPIAQLYFALGHPELHRLFTAIRTGVIICIIYPAVKLYGLNGAAIAGMVSMLIGYIFQVIRLKEMTHLNLWEYMLVFIKAIGISTCVVLVWAITRTLLPTQPVIGMLPGLLGCLFTYGLMILTMNKFKGKLFSQLAMKGESLQK